jgi:chromate transporter
MTSFGGPIAHLGYFHDEFVKKKKWLSDQAYGDLVALCQFLPGPASSQVGMAIGLSRAGIRGAILAWAGFTLPSAIILVLFGLGLTHFTNVLQSNWLHGLKIVAVAIVAQAVFNMARKFCPDSKRALIALGSALVILFLQSALAQVGVLIFSGSLGAVWFNASYELPLEPIPTRHHRKTGAIFLFAFAILLIGLPILRSISPSQGFMLFDSFFRAGALVFGGGHVVLPFLQSEVIPPGWVSKELFMAGYGAAQAIPGPLFAFSAFIGAVSHSAPNGWQGALLCLIAAFLPSFLLIIGVLPYWDELRKQKRVRQSMLAVNASVVGILFAALYQPVWVSAIFTFKDFALAAAAFCLLEFAKWRSWIVVLTTILLSLVLY